MHATHRPLAPPPPPLAHPRRHGARKRADAGWNPAYSWASAPEKRGEGGDVPNRGVSPPRQRCPRFATHTTRPRNGPVKQRGGAHWGERAPPQQRRIGGNLVRRMPSLRPDGLSVLQKEDTATEILREIADVDDNSVTMSLRGAVPARNRTSHAPRPGLRRPIGSSRSPDDSTRPPGTVAVERG